MDYMTTRRRPSALPRRQAGASLTEGGLRRLQSEIPMNDVQTKVQSGAGELFSRSRLLHTIIRVFDLEKSIDFDTRLLGMKLLRRKDFPTGEFTLAFVGYGDETNSAVIE